MKPIRRICLLTCGACTVTLQVISALLVGLFYYMIAMAMTVYDGVLSLIFQPIMGAILTSIAIIILFIAGLPLRLIKPLNTWWKRHWWLAFVIGSVAFAMMYASWLPQYRVRDIDPDLGIQVDSFHPLLALGGWSLTIFAVLHFYPPLPFRFTNPKPTVPCL